MTKLSPAACLFVVTLSSGVPAAAQEIFPRNELLLSTAHESLDHGLRDWTESTLQLGHQFARNQSVYGGARQTSRFGLQDREASLGGYLPLSDALTANLEIAGSATHRVLPENILSAQLACALGGGYVLGTGLRRSEYSSTSSTLAQTGLERYLGNWRLGYTLYLAKADQTAWSPSHRLVGAYYFDDSASLSLSIAKGRELENVNGTGLRITDVRDVTLSAALPIIRGFSLTLDASHHKQGDLYTRRGIRIGSKIVF